MFELISDCRNSQKQKIFCAPPSECNVLTWLPLYYREYLGHKNHQDKTCEGGDSKTIQLHFNKLMSTSCHPHDLHVLNLIALFLSAHTYSNHSGEEPRQQVCLNMSYLITQLILAFSTSEPSNSAFSDASCRIYEHRLHGSCVCGSM